MSQIPATLTFYKLLVQNVRTSFFFFFVKQGWCFLPVQFFRSIFFIQIEQAEFGEETRNIYDSSLGNRCPIKIQSFPCKSMDLLMERMAFPPHTESGGIIGSWMPKGSRSAALGVGAQYSRSNGIQGVQGLPFLQPPTPPQSYFLKNDGIHVLLNKYILGDYTYTHMLEQ